jgi:hypothetical protein
VNEAHVACAVQEKGQGGGGGGGGLDSSLSGLLDHYRSCVKCHCKSGDKAPDKERVLPCGHASCKKVLVPCASALLALLSHLLLWCVACTSVHAPISRMGSGVKTRAEKIIPDVCFGSGILQCIEKLVKDRSRKCPQCSLKFDQNEVRPLHLQTSFGDL